MPSRFLREYKQGKEMKSVVILVCCSYEVKTGTKTYRYIDCFKLKSGEKFFKKKLSDGREIKKELLLVAFCPNCKHYVIRFLFYAKAGTRFQDWDETKIVRGKKADEIFTRRNELYDLISLPDPFKPQLETKHSKKIPWVYYKTVDSFSQIPRYIDESEDAGLKIVSPPKVEKC